ncbi:hypothetical protein BU26DRAFT_505104 [Trematosphaeria pertusa]|uniref:Uncharacterized protein n=1 Tax=Trematosphaeria pertusa TaxID=390896 RepID=A0A6A6IEJ0_9PLEO|nr:uncharacterized protein BU26DRAFT_505104 [Trematosphaeria pertusa]KAF2248995.1 hypothetical protein BU26DRAFT_505104 [Trematosphaeria pertusa]
MYLSVHGRMYAGAGAAKRSVGGCVDSWLSRVAGTVTSDSDTAAKSVSRGWPALVLVRIASFKAAASLRWASPRRKAAAALQMDEQTVHWRSLRSGMVVEDIGGAINLSQGQISVPAFAAAATRPSQRQRSCCFPFRGSLRSKLCGAGNALQCKNSVPLGAYDLGLEDERLREPRGLCCSVGAGPIIVRSGSIVKTTVDSPWSQSVLLKLQPKRAITACRRKSNQYPDSRFRMAIDLDDLPYR